jgi:hypothetical protein
MHFPWRAFFGMALALVLLVPAGAETLTPGLLTAMQNGSLAHYRGGASSGQPLGMYTIKDHHVVFSSAYKDEPPAIQAAFADYLREYVELKHGGWDNYARAERQEAALHKSVEDIITDHSTGIFDHTYVAYADQRRVAEEWWLAHSKSFHDTWGKDAFLSDAILDANNAYMVWQFVTTDHNNADHQIWILTTLGQLYQKR